MHPLKSDEKLDLVAQLLKDFSEDLRDAVHDLDHITNKYEGGWENEALNCATGLTASLNDLIDKISTLTGEEWVDLHGAELVCDP